MEIDGMEIDRSKEELSSTAEMNTDDVEAKPIFESIPKPQNFNLSRHVKRYSGKILISRLLFIAERCAELSGEAYSISIAKIKEGMFLQMYAEILPLLGAQIQPENETDANWADQAAEKLKNQIEALESEIQAQKTLLNRDDLNRLYCEIARLHYLRGDVNASLTFYNRARNFCSDFAKNLEVSIEICNISLERKCSNGANLPFSYYKSNSCLNTCENSKLEACEGLVFMLQKNFSRSADHFKKVRLELGKSINFIVALEDVAAYGSLCALASHPHNSIKSDFLNSVHFSPILDTVPTFRKLLGHFVKAEFKECIALLKEMRDELALDMHLNTILPLMEEKIWDNCTLHYLLPYSKIKMADTSEALGLSGAYVEECVIRLIRSKKINLKIDKSSGTFVLSNASSKQAAYKTVMETSGNARREMRAALLRASCSEHGLIVTGTSKYEADSEDNQNNAGKILDLDDLKVDRQGFSIGGMPC